MEAGGAIIGCEFKIPLALNSSSSTDAELSTIIRAIEEIPDRYSEGSKVVIFTDSMTSLFILKNSKEGIEVRELLGRTQSAFKVFLQWIPSHCGIMGNETADLLAKQASTMGPRPQESRSLRSMLNLLENYHTNQWIEEWQNSEKHKNFQELQPKPCRGNYNSLNRKQQVIISRVRMGHFPSSERLFRWGQLASERCLLCDAEKGDLKHVITRCAAVRRPLELENGSLLEILGDRGNWGAVADAAAEWMRGHQAMGSHSTP